MPSLDDYPAIRDSLMDRYGRANFEQADREPFTRIVVAWLSRSVPVKNAIAARDQLRDDGLLDASAIADAHPTELAESLRSSGAKLTSKAVANLKKLAAWVVSRGEDALVDAPTTALRDELIAINGIGPSTADAILLEALDRAVFPVDRPSYRIFARHGWIDPTADYDEARDTFERLEPDEPSGLRQLGIWLDEVASDYCRATKPKCEKCPLKPFLPESGPLDPSGD